MGIGWYADFDTPQWDGRRFWIGRAANWGALLGGHAICAQPGGVRDATGWYEFYDQGQEGACVGFSCSRMMSLLNRKRYDARWLYVEGKRNDAYPGEDYEGTEMRAGPHVLMTQGHRRVVRGKSYPVDPAEGIAAFRWATTADEVLRVLANTTGNRLGAVPLLNSWGPFYPRRVWLPAEALTRLLSEDGEAMLVTDR